MCLSLSLRDIYCALSIVDFCPDNRDYHCNLKKNSEEAEEEEEEGEEEEEEELRRRRYIHNCFLTPS